MEPDVRQRVARQGLRYCFRRPQQKGPRNAGGQPQWTGTPDVLVGRFALLAEVASPIPVDAVVVTGTGLGGEALVGRSDPTSLVLSATGCAADPTWCDDGNPCTDDGCDAATGTCTYTPLDGIACDDGAACTVSDVCQATTCAGTLLACEAGCGGQCVVNTPECTTYGVLDQADRNVSFHDGHGGVEVCDSSLNGWYRFTGGAGTLMPSTAPPIYSWGTDAPRWLNGTYPTVAEGIVDRTVCFHWSGNACYWSRVVQVRNCGTFYVVHLVPTPGCSLRYCGQERAARGMLPASSPLPARGCRTLAVAGAVRPLRPPRGHHVQPIDGCHIHRQKNFWKLLAAQFDL